MIVFAYRLSQFCPHHSHYEWNSAVIGFHDDGQEQYKWVIEYQCGTRPDLPAELCRGKTVDGRCFFTGVQLYVRDFDFLDEGREEMVAYINSLGPKTSGSLEVGWVMNDFGAGTFPRFFKNDTVSGLRHPRVLMHTNSDKLFVPTRPPVPPQLHEGADRLPLPVQDRLLARRPAVLGLLHRQLFIA